MSDVKADFIKKMKTLNSKKNFINLFNENSEITSFNDFIWCENKNKTIFGHKLSQSNILFKNYGYSNRQDSIKQFNILQHMADNGASWLEVFNKSSSNKERQEILLADYAVIFFSSLPLDQENNSNNILKSKPKQLYQSLLNTKVDKVAEIFSLSKFDKITYEFQKILSDHQRMLTVKKFYYLWDIYFHMNKENEDLKKSISIKTLNSLSSMLSENYYSPGFTAELMDVIDCFDLPFLNNDNGNHNLLNEVKQRFYSYVINSNDEDIKKTYFELCEQILESSSQVESHPKTSSFSIDLETKYTLRPFEFKS